MPTWEETIALDAAALHRYTPLLKSTRTLTKRQRKAVSGTIRWWRSYMTEEALIAEDGWQALIEEEEERHRRLFVYLQYLEVHLRKLDRILALRAKEVDAARFDFPPQSSYKKVSF